MREKSNTYKKAEISPCFLFIFIIVAFFLVYIASTSRIILTLQVLVLLLTKNTTSTSKAITKVYYTIIHHKGDDVHFVNRCCAIVHAIVAQSVERSHGKGKIAGSIPVCGLLAI